MIDKAQAAREVVSRALANGLVATLDDRPFLLTAAQLAWVDGGELVAGQENGPLTRIVAGRFATLFADHVIGDVSADGAPGAYVRVLECARQAFLQSLPGRSPADRDALRREKEGGTATDGGATRHLAVGARNERVAAR
jgi:hypothetical protein